MDCPCHKRNTLAGLPDEAMLEILARVPFRSVCRSKCVAKAWRDLIDDPLNRRRLPQTLQGFFFVSCSLGNMENCFVKYSGSSVPLDIDPCFSFLTSPPETERLWFVDSCNGLLLFERCLKSNLYDVLGYIVCNPATKHWATVPVCACCPPPKAQSEWGTYLIFDPARYQSVSPHFHLIQFFEGGWDKDPLTCEEINKLDLLVHTYSSETGVWSHNQTDWNEQEQLERWRHQGYLNSRFCHRTFVNGTQYLIVSDLDKHQIVAVDVQGKTKRIITRPDAAERLRWYSSRHIGQSQGRLYYIKDFDLMQVQSSELSIWVLQDYDTQEWVLKDTVSFSTLFGRIAGTWKFVDIHPDRNVVFFVGPMNRLIAYDMDRKEVSVVATLNEDLAGRIVPYIPYFSEAPSLTNKN